ncbi:hypothetical protein ABFT23_01140 [Nocardioides sp. C4-1]|uniref:hypothetical protein n=1 Tax=Nocardioides sp. C4-1 TaxID=3151851 RepID=UPI0032633D8C
MPAEPTAERPPSPTSRRAPRRGRGLVLVIVALVLVVVGAVVVFAVTRDSADDGSDDARDPGTEDFVDLSGDEIMDTALTYMAAVASVRLQRTYTSSEGTTTVIDLVTTPNGDCEGQLGLDDGRADIKVHQRQVYVRGDRAFLTGFGYGDFGPGVLEQAVDRWHHPLGYTTDLITGYCDVDTYLDQLVAQGDDAVNDKGDTAPFTDVAGLDDGTSISIANSGTRPDEIDPGADADTEPDPIAATVTVSVDEPHYVLSIVESETDRTSTYSDFDVTLRVEPPPEDDVLDLIDIVSPAVSGTDG